MFLDDYFKPCRWFKLLTHIGSMLIDTPTSPPSVLGQPSDPRRIAALGSGLPGGRLSGLTGGEGST